MRYCVPIYPHHPHFGSLLVTTTPTPLQLPEKPSNSSFYLVTPLLPFFPIIESYSSSCMSPYGSQLIASLVWQSGHDLNTMGYMGYYSSSTTS